MYTFLRNCHEKYANNCNGCKALLGGMCLCQNANFPKGVNVNLFRLSKSEKDVIEVLLKARVAKAIQLKSGDYTKRHAKAIDSLKAKAIIYKDDKNILKLVMDIFE